VGKAMSNDKLKRTARAAGFAMAIDETVGGPLAQATVAPPTSGPKLLEAPRGTRGQPVALGEKASPAWAFSGWTTFWKTA